MSTVPLEAVLLKQLVFMERPQRVLEVGMFVGYGAAAMLEGSPTTQVVSLEIDPYLETWLSSCLKQGGFDSIAERHEVMLGPALDSIPKLTGQFDLVASSSVTMYSHCLDLAHGLPMAARKARQ